MDGNLTKERLTLEQAREIQNWSERIFAIALCSIPHLEVFHEPHAVTNKSGKTVPDFLVRNTRRGQHASDIYFEVTGAKDLGGHRKKKQKRVMTREATDRKKTKYFQLPREVLQKIACAKNIESDLDVCARLKLASPPRTQLSPEGQERLRRRLEKRHAQIR